MRERTHVRANKPDFNKLMKENELRQRLQRIHRRHDLLRDSGRRNAMPPPPGRPWQADVYIWERGSRGKTDALRNAFTSEKSEILTGTNVQG